MAKVTGDVEVLGSQTLLEVVNSEVSHRHDDQGHGAVELTDEDLSAFAGKTNEKRR